MKIYLPICNFFANQFISSLKHIMLGWGIFSFAFTPLASAQSANQGTNSSTYPNKQINLIVPYSTGSSADVLSRAIGTKLAERLGVTVIVDNRAGAAGVIGSEFAAKASPNGYTLLFTATSHASVPAVRSKMPYDPVNAFSSVILLANSAMCLVVTPSLPVNSVKEFVDLVKANPDKYSYASPGTGTTQHLAMELFLQATGIKMLHVPYKGISTATTDLIAGHIQAGVVSLQVGGTFIQNGQLKMLTVMGEERSPLFSNIPTLKQSGIPEVVDTWYGVLAPAKTPPEIIRKLNAEINSILTTQELKDIMVKQSLNSVGGGPEKMQDLLVKDVAKWARVVKNSNLKLE